MQATRPNVFALRRSGLEAFLYADVGAEANGSTLTVLSILARLGKDPWSEAARWAALPKAVVIDSLAQSIAEMPLAPSALAGARDSAISLVRLLPPNTQSLRQGSAVGSATVTQTLMPIAIVCVVLVVGMALNLLIVAKSPSTVAAPIGESAAATEAARPTARSLPTGAPAGGPLAAPAGRRNGFPP